MSSDEEGRKRRMKFHYDPVTASVFNAAWWMPLVFVCVFLNDSSAVLDTETNTIISVCSISEHLILHACVHISTGAVTV